MERKDAPLYFAVKDVKDDIRFCMPSHAGLADGGLFASAPYDYTEVSGLDNLLCADGVILQSETLAAKDYKCAHTLYCTCGSTVCMHIALSIAKERGGDIAAIGDMHKSFYGGCNLLSLSPVVFSSVEEFLQNSSKTQNLSAVFFTSPDYYGNVKNTDNLIEYCAKNGILTVADSAHGAHFAFSRLLPEDLSGKADIVFVSFHKTMAAYTAAAAINLKDASLYDRAVYYRQLWHTTSPSYLAMTSIDYSLALWREKGENFYADIFREREKFAKACEGLPFRVCDSDDMSRLVIAFDGYDAGEADAYLVKNGIFAEAAIADKLIFIINPFNKDKLGYLAGVLARFVPTKTLCVPEPPRRERRAAGAKVAFVSIEQAAGRVAANEIGFYPPGTPYIRRGEVITDDDVSVLRQNKSRVFGLVNGKVVVIQ